MPTSNLLVRVDGFVAAQLELTRLQHLGEYNGHFGDVC